MPQHITHPTRIPVPGGKLIEEFVGRLSTDTHALSVAHMIAPPGWDEPFQTPDFDEVTVVLRGTMRVEHAAGATDVAAGEVILCRAGERVRYANPFKEKAEYWAICTPAFSLDKACRETE